MIHRNLRRCTVACLLVLVTWAYLRVGIDQMASPVVILRQGTFKGAINQNPSFPQVVEWFLGIPYAKSPAGDRRFRPPVTVDSSNDTFSAAHWGPRCPVGQLDDPNAPEGEDCLNLNVFRPRNRDLGKKYPVLVYFHGGSFNFGNAKWTAISSLVAWSPEPMVGVSFNYRLGALGFLPAKVTAQEGLLNLGLKDQRMLLEWVQENIAAFGGDPDSVTVMGSSAGAHSIGHHIMANADKPPLFHRAIMESGAPTARAVYPYDNPLHVKQFGDFTKAVGSSHIAEDSLMSHLRTLPLSVIVDASSSVYNKFSPSNRWAFQPCIEGPGGYISKAPIDAWRSGNWHRVPILTGFNTNEGAPFVPSSLSTPEEFRDFFRNLLPGFSASELDQIERLYPDPSTDPTSPYVETRRGVGKQFKRVEAAYGQWAYISPVRQTARLATTLGLGHSSANFTNAALKLPVYLYHFAVNRTLHGGASHGDQSEYVTFSPNIVGFSESQRQIAGQMHAYWVSFILTGDPNLVKGRWPSRPFWPAHDGVGTNGEKMVFGEGNDELAGGKDVGKPAKEADDTWMRKESEFWWSKTEISER